MIYSKYVYIQIRGGFLLLSPSRARDDLNSKTDTLALVSGQQARLRILIVERLLYFAFCLGLSCGLAVLR